MIYLPCQVSSYEIVDLNYYTFHHMSHVYTHMSLVTHFAAFDRLDGPSNHRGVKHVVFHKKSIFFYRFFALIKSTGMPQKSFLKNIYSSITMDLKMQKHYTISLPFFTT